MLIGAKFKVCYHQLCLYRQYYDWHSTCQDRLQPSRVVRWIQRFWQHRWWYCFQRNVQLQMQRKMRNPDYLTTILKKNKKNSQFKLFAFHRVQGGIYQRRTRSKLSNWLTAKLESFRLQLSDSFRKISNLCLLFIHILLLLSKSYQQHVHPFSDFSCI